MERAASGRVGDGCGGIDGTGKLAARVARGANQGLLGVFLLAVGFPVLIHVEPDKNASERFDKTGKKLLASTPQALHIETFCTIGLRRKMCSRQSVLASFTYFRNHCATLKHWKLLL